MRLSSTRFDTAALSTAGSSFALPAASTLNSLGFIEKRLEKAKVDKELSIFGLVAKHHERQMRISSKLTNPILSEIKHYFGFLLDRGYQIQKTDVSFWANRNWGIILASPACVIKIYSDQFTVFLVFAPINEDIDDRLEISGLIYYLSKGNKFIGKLESDYHRNRKEQLEKLANLLEEYIDQITPYFSVKEFQVYKSELLTASQEYGRLYMRKYVPGF